VKDAVRNEAGREKRDERGNLLAGTRRLDLVRLARVRRAFSIHHSSRRKTMKFRSIALAASVLALAGCADKLPLSTAPGDASFSAHPASNGVAQSINGNADINAPQGLRRMAIHARKSTDGTVSGRLVIRQEWVDGNTIEADITCFTIVDNRAYVGAVVKEMNGVPFEDFLAFRLVMIDNGEGANAAPDQSSQAATSGPQAIPQPQTFCNNANLVLPMHDLVRGNLAIRP
jgi:hypothetical protein